MKNNIGHIFVDDGYPESDEYDTNYVSYNLQIPGSYNRAAETARGMLAASRDLKNIAFKPIAIEHQPGVHCSRSYRRRRFPMGLGLIRNTLRRFKSV